MIGNKVELYGTVTAMVTTTYAHGGMSTTFRLLWADGMSVPCVVHGKVPHNMDHYRQVMLHGGMVNYKGEMVVKCEQIQVVRQNKMISVYLDVEEKIGLMANIMMVAGVVLDEHTVLHEHRWRFGKIHSKIYTIAVDTVMGRAPGMRIRANGRVGVVDGKTVMLVTKLRP